MRAWVNDIERARIELREIPEPLPGPGELLVEVRAAGVNRADLAMRSGRYRPGFGSAEVAGIEGAGVVVALGEGCRRFAVGDAVMGMCTGTYAERCVMDEGVAMAVPPSLAFPEAAVLPVACCTVHDALVGKAHLSPGETVLVTAATSGVGELATKIARLLGAGRIIGTTRSAERAGRVAGADDVVVTSAGFVEAVLSLTGQVGVDIVLDHVGGALLDGLIGAVAIGGRIVSIGRLGGGTSEINVDELARKQACLIGVTFRTRSREQYREIAQSTASDLLGPIGSGALRALVEARFAFERADEAQEALARGEYVGKLALTLEAAPGA